MHALTLLVTLVGLMRSAVALGPDTAGGMPGEVTRSGQVWLRGGLSVPCDLDVTAKGNGFLTVNGLGVRVVDEHDDGTLFLPYTCVYGCCPGLRSGEGVLFTAGLLATTDDRQRHLTIIGAVPFLRLYSVHGGDTPVRLFALPSPVGDRCWEI